MLTLAQVMAKRSHALRQDKFYRMKLALRDEQDYSNEPQPEPPQSPTRAVKPVINITYQVDGKSTPIFKELQEQINQLRFQLHQKSVVTEQRGEGEVNNREDITDRLYR